METINSHEHVQPLIRVAAADAGLAFEVRALAERLGLEAGTWEDGATDMLLRLDHEGLGLWQPLGRGPGITVRADYVHGPFGFRRRHGKHLLCRAAHVKGLSGDEATLLDATAGLGRDAFLLADHGWRVRMVERRLILAALIADGLRRASLDERTRKTTARIELIQDDARRVLDRISTTDERLAVIFLDPMFPPARGSALAGKEAMLLQALAGRDDNGGELLELALCAATHRVVVKRPLRGAPLPGPVPTMSLTGKTVRYDVYLCDR